MAIIPFKKIFAKDDVVQRFQDNVGNVFDSLQKSLLINANLVQDIAFTSGTDTYVSHSLNRPVTGFFVVMKTTPVDIYKSSTASPADDLIIILRSDASTTVSIVFF